MHSAWRAGVAYFAGMFALGFVLGTVRVLLVEPSLGRWVATSIELPVMLGAAWLYAAWLIGRLQVAPTAAARWAMGGWALLLLLAAEFALGVALFGRTGVEQGRAMTSGPGLMGLTGQVFFAAIPWLQLRLGRSKERLRRPL